MAGGMGGGGRGLHVPQTFARTKDKETTHRGGKIELITSSKSDATFAAFFAAAATADASVPAPSPTCSGASKKRSVGGGSATDIAVQNATKGGRRGCPREWGENVCTLSLPPRRLNFSVCSLSQLEFEAGASTEVRSSSAPPPTRTPPRAAPPPPPSDKHTLCCRKSARAPVDFFAALLLCRPQSLARALRVTILRFR